MNAALEAYLTQLLSIRQDLPGLAGPLDHRQFNWTPAPGRWSVGQCVEHLNITMERYVPVLEQAISTARAKGLVSPGPFALGLMERWFMRSLEPPVKYRVRTRKAFVPAPDLPPAATVARFSALQAAFDACIRQADGLDLRTVKVKSQFGPLSWSLNGTFAILLAHERRHIWQARQVRNDRGFPSGQSGAGSS
ncbi:MAG: DinB family protein [Vicinamibacterales bacterium]